MRLKVVVVAAVVAKASWSVELPPPRLCEFTLDCLSCYLKPWLKVVLNSSWLGSEPPPPEYYVLSTWIDDTLRARLVCPRVIFCYTMTLLSCHPMLFCNFFSNLLCGPPPLPS